jgi:hypothetical protein
LRLPGPAGAWRRSRSALPCIQRSAGIHHRTSSTGHCVPVEEVPLRLPGPAGAHDAETLHISALVSGWSWPGCWLPRFLPFRLGALGAASGAPGPLGVSLDSQPEESAPPGGSMDNHPAGWPGLVGLTVQRSGNPPVSVWATVHRSWARKPVDLTGKRSASGDATVAPASTVRGLASRSTSPANGPRQATPRSRLRAGVALSSPSPSYTTGCARYPSTVDAPGQVSRPVPGSPGSALL